MTLLKFENVTYVKDDKTILKNISVDVEKGDFISIVGSSGSGKSTFLKLCSYLISPTEGGIFYKNRSYEEYDPIKWRQWIAYCFQTPYLFGDTVMDNLKFPYSIRSSKFDLSRAEQLFTDFKLSEDYLKREVRDLSGGEKQRIALIRTLLFKPDILLLDEVTSALDVDNTLIVEGVIESLNENGITILWVTHNPKQSKKYANKVLTIENGRAKSLEVLK
ncbi:ATP-binding cassette domain-containing protein [Clostridium sp. 001]|uniref:ABC transporter ATP-binding protein n=1 Tax=Clostridium sp. 001 TaxID=1970093 RepID=UPI001C2C1B29|nr:ATP-binding cassette domain-containing protein [Clostridium sp. 001]QXE19726.1 methionine ABC transporter ATP-binding protein [Clostridium sp. 001]